jgi:hypothetical protein
LIASPTFIRRLQQLDPALQLRWSEPRGQWSIERLVPQSSRALGLEPSSRDLYYWGRGKFLAASLIQLPGGAIVSAEEYRLVPAHLCWWGGPLDQSLITTLQHFDSHRVNANPAQAFDTLVGQPAAAAEASARRDALQPLAEMRRDLAHQVRRATGQTITVPV